jgi:hypothetical protein
MIQFSTEIISIMILWLFAEKFYFRAKSLPNFDGIACERDHISHNRSSTIMPPVTVSPPTDVGEKVYTILVADPRLIATCCAVCNWLPEKAERIAKSYAQFMALKVLMEDYEDNKLVPSGLIEDMWCTHILCTKLQYDKTCEKICGRVIHYDPCFKDNEKHSFGRMTKAVAKFRFEDDLDEEIWHYGYQDADAHVTEEAKEEKNKEQERDTIQEVAVVPKIKVEDIGIVEFEENEIEMVNEPAKRVRPTLEMKAKMSVMRRGGRVKKFEEPEIRDAADTTYTDEELDVITISRSPLSYELPTKVE